MPTRTINVLLIEDNEQFARLVSLYLQKYEEAKFKVTWKPDGASGLEAVKDEGSFDIILMDYFLPGRNGFEIARELYDKNYRIPIVFLTMNQEFDLVLEVMKLGVEDYLVKEEILSPILPKTILSVLERRDLKKRLQDLEISEKRLQAIQELVLSVSAEVEDPLKTLRAKVDLLSGSPVSQTVKNYLSMIVMSLDRIDQKLRRLKELKEAKTVSYVRDIKMIDLSE